MRRPAAWSLMPICAFLLATGCNKQGPEPPHVPSEQAAAGSDSIDGPADRPPPPEPPPLPEAAPNEVAVGSALGDNGAVQAPKRSYAVSDTVHASVPTAGHAPGDTVTVYWTHEDGGVDKDESRPIGTGSSYASFSFSSADGMRAGDYNVQVDVNDVPVGLVDFTVE